MRSDDKDSDYTPLHGKAALSLSFQLWGLERAECAPSGNDQKAGLQGKQKGGHECQERDCILHIHSASHPSSLIKCRLNNPLHMAISCTCTFSVLCKSWCSKQAKTIRMKTKESKKNIAHFPSHLSLLFYFICTIFILNSQTIYEAVVICKDPPALLSL